MSSNSLTYGLKFSQEEYETIEDLASVGYNDVKIALYFDIPYKEFKKEFDDKNGLIWRHFTIGLIKTDADVGIGLANNAKSGNITAVQQLERIRKKQKVEIVKQQIYFSNELD